MKQATLTDQRSGKSVEVQYDPDEGRYLIDNVLVRLVEDAESDEDELVFALDQPELGATQVYHLPRQEVDQLQGPSLSTRQ